MKGKTLLALARVGWVGGILSFAFRHFSHALPINRVYEDARLVAFLHPAPSYTPHVLIVPKARARTPVDVSDEDFERAVRAADRIAAEGDWSLPLYQLRINGGTRQDVAQAHFHLIPASGIFGEKMERLPRDRALPRGYSISVYLGLAGYYLTGEDA